MCRLRVSRADSLASWFLDVMQTEIQRNPNWLFDIRCLNQEDTVSELLAGKALVAVTTQKKAPQGFKSIHLGTHRYRAVAGAEFMNRYFADGVNETSILNAPALSGGQDDLQHQWLFDVYKKELPIISHRIPNSMSFVSATKKNIGWSVNPTEMVQEGIDSGELFELIPSKTLDKKIYWQFCRAIADSVKPLTDTITNVARKNLIQEETQIFKIKLSKPEDLGEDRVRN